MRELPLAWRGSAIQPERLPPDVEPIFRRLGLLRKRVLLTGGKSGAAFRCKHWFLDARRGIQYLNRRFESKAYKSICIECLSDDMLRTNLDEVQKYGKLSTSIQRRDEARYRRSWKSYGISTPRCYLH